ncbi:hypothetical protein [Flavobacterium sp. fv08]|uniref:hypothetical protein n=1 Tax=Flavobacterium sp. fv08 TaxID=1761784 RepID=UPI0008B0884F|nr:hypothetical protein [Flavobacterium sp. fv08]SEP06887.1 hypothetical protein SAMN04487978_4376 [Flavobacterium sp. fv08]
MKAKYLLMFLLLFQVVELPAQSTQQSVLLQQIAALRVYGDYIHKGYNVVKKGLNIIGDFKEGEKLLHSDYFKSLGLINKVIYDDGTAGKAVSLYHQILNDADLYQTVLDSDLLSPQELSYCERVKKRLLGSCHQQIGFLYDLLSDDTLRMDDAKRLESIEDIYREMKDNYTFIKRFNTETVALIKTRQVEGREAVNSAKLFNIK